MIRIDTGYRFSKYGLDLSEEKLRLLNLTDVQNEVDEPEEKS